MGLRIDRRPKLRIKSLSKNPPKWRRPKAGDVAMSMNLSFLYKYGYDFASTYVHPMANDGDQDFYTLTKLKPTPPFPDQISVLSNSILVGSLILQEALNLKLVPVAPCAVGLFGANGAFFGEGRQRLRKVFPQAWGNVSKRRIMRESSLAGSTGPWAKSASDERRWPYMMKITKSSGKKRKGQVLQ